MATATRTVAEYSTMHILPLELSADYWSDDVPVITLTHWTFLLSFLGICALLASAIWKAKTMNAYAWGILFFFITLAPVSNFFFAAGFLKAERILYIPSAGMIVAMSAIVIQFIVLKKFKLTGIVVAGLLTAFYVFKTLERQPAWKDNLALANATLEVSPSSPRFNNVKGLELSRQGNTKEAIIYYEKAVQSNSNHVPALVNLANAYKGQKRIVEAAGILEKALLIDPTLLATYVNLMSVYRAMEDYDKNLLVAQKAVERFPGSAAVLWNAANAYQLKNQMEISNQLRTRARAIDPSIGTQ
jgi:tetratricopeptide (TPR) repeat protein